MLQMGLRLLSVNGKEISGVRRWIQKCFCCGRTETDMEREFCDWCGHHTLARAVVAVKADGTVEIYENKRYIYNLRGTKYPVPLPKGGRRNKDLKFSEDVMSDKRLYPHKKNRLGGESFFQMGSDFAFSRAKNPMQEDVVSWAFLLSSVQFLLPKISECDLCCCCFVFTLSAVMDGMME